MIGFKDEYMPKCIDFIPPVYANIKEFQALAKSYNAELTLTANRLDEVYNNFFIDSLNEYGCIRWEKILKLESNNSFSLKDRRFAIKVKLLGHRPYTFFRLKKILNDVISEDNYRLDLDVDKNHITCRVNLGVKARFITIKNMLEKTVPLNISLDVELLYNTHEMLGGYTHEYLGKFTHQQLKEEVFK